MDTAAKLKQFLFALLFLPTFALAQSTAGTEIANIQSWLNSEGQKFYKPGTGDQWVRNSSPNGDRYIKVETNIDYKAQNGRLYPVVIEKTAQIEASKIGKAVTTFAKLYTPLAVGLEVVTLICSLSMICQNTETNTWEKRGTGTVLEQTANINDCATFPSGLSFLPHQGGYTEFLRQGKQPTCAADPRPQYTFRLSCQASKTGCAGGDEVWQTTRTGTVPQTETRTATEQDWTDAETKLNDPRFDEPLLVNGQPVPLANLPIFGSNPPITLSDTETINRDGNGNVTGTTRTKTTLTLTDTATETRPGSVTGTETTTKTDYDTQGQPTGTQTTTSNPPPPEKPAEPPTISFDDVQDSEIEEEEIDAELDTAESWGEGFCPPNETISYGYGTLTFDYQPACNFATNVRPVILLIASITAMFIVSGIRVE